MQKLIDFKNGITGDASLRPVVVNATVNGSGVDMAGAVAERRFALISVGVVTGAAIVNVQIQESDASGSGYANIADAGGLSANISAAGTALLSFASAKRYNRAVITLVSGTSNVMEVFIGGQLKVEGSNAAGYSLSPAG